MKRIPKRTLPLPFTALLALILGGFVTVLALWCQPNRLRDVAAIFLFEKPVLILLNALPVDLSLLVLWFLFGNLFDGAAAASLIWGLLSVVNRIKIQVRDEPLFPRDFALLKEAGSAAESYGIQFPVFVIAVVLGVSLLLALLGRIFVTMPDFSSRRRRWTVRLAGAAGGFAFLTTLVLTVLSSTAVYDSLGASSPYRLSVVFNENGFPYNFCHQFTKYLVEKPAGYSRAQAREWDEDQTAGAAGSSGAPVHVVLVMDEAFSDISDDPAFAFSTEDDPLPRLHALRQDPHALSLRLVVPGFAGGTANTEFDVFTGIQTNSLGASSAMRTVNRNLDSLFRVFGAEDYHTAFCHPGDDWFYNRENVYRWLGAEETVFVDQMESPERKGGWVTDRYLAGVIESAFTDAVERGELLFHCTTTIQNHMGYPRNKYGEGYEYPPVSLSVTVDDAVRRMLEVYLEGIRDADAMLGELQDYFAAREEPVVLVFYGDHLPYLGDNRLAYAALGMDIAKDDALRENYFSIYETPCVLWANDAAAAVLDWATAVRNLDLPENGRLSAAFLGPALLELTRRRDANPWTAFLNDLRRQVPVVQGEVWMLPDGTVQAAEPDSPLSGEILKWRQWSYYKLTQKTLS